MAERQVFELVGDNNETAKIAVFGVGGGGGNTVRNMQEKAMQNVTFIVANTDRQVLQQAIADTVLQLGTQLTSGLGAGADPEIGRQAAEEDRQKIREILQGMDMVFITAGMGGGTGTGAAPVVAEIAKELGILTVAVVTKPFSFEGRARKQVADQGIANLYQYVDSLIIIPNDKLLTVLGKNISLLNAFKAADNVTLGAVQGIADLITCPGLINVDFADVRTVMSEMGMAMMGTGVASGENRARQAAEAAIASPLLEDINLSGARGILVNITAGLNMSIGEFEEVGDAVKAFTSENATVVVGTVIDPEMSDEMRVTVVVTGLENPHKAKQSHAVPLVESAFHEGAIDYHKFDKPAVMRKAVTGAARAVSRSEFGVPRSAGNSDNAGEAAGEMQSQAVDYLDIPAFLRRSGRKEKL
ncbi:MAG: ftsZ [Gammaproteobacteria bacterium]|jgi:cell division protein FtsZ|nr:ftsZ [Gammaproteobacteria bacterium]